MATPIPADPAPAITTFKSLRALIGNPYNRRAPNNPDNDVAAVP